MATIKYKKKDMAPEVAAAPPEEAPGMEAEATAGAPESEEKYGAQVLRKVHKDHQIIMQDYDEMLKLLEEADVADHLKSILEDCETKLTETENLFEQAYSEEGYEPLEGAMGPEDTGKDMDAESGEIQEELNEEEKDEPTEPPEQATSREEEEPTEDEVLEGMQTKRLKYQAKGCGCHDTKSAKRPTGNWQGVRGKTPYKTRQGRKDLCPTCGKDPCVCSKSLRTGKKSRELGVEDGHVPGEQALNQQKVSDPIVDVNKVEELDTAANMTKAGEFEQVEGMDAEANVQAPSLEPHHVKSISEAQGFLNEVAQSHDFGDEHRHKSYHYHKALGDIADTLEPHTPPFNPGGDADVPPYPGKDFPEVAKLDNRVNVTDPKSPTKYSPGSEPAQQFGTDADSAKDFPEVAREHNEIDITKPSSPTEIKPNTEPMQQLEPSVKSYGSIGYHKAIKDASSFLRELSDTHEITDDHRNKAYGHAKMLEPITQMAQEVNVTDPAGPTEVNPGTEPAQQFGTKNLETLKKVYADQGKTIRGLIDRVSSLVKFVN